MNLIERAKNIVLTPNTEWPVVESEASSVASIYTGYLVILAAIPVIAGFIGSSFIGTSVMGMTFRTPIVAGIVQMILGYALSLGSVFVISLIADALAPSFDGQKNPLNAFKLIAFSFTPIYLAGILRIIPLLSLLSLLAAGYSVYMLYLGIPTLMKVPKEKAAVYAIVLIVISIVAMVLIGGVVGLIGAIGA